jgi:hypothetical protein
MKKLRKLAIAAVPALGMIFATAASAQQITCMEAGALNQALEQYEGEKPTGDVAKDIGPWAEVSLYADEADGSWSLVAAPNAETAKQIGAPDGVDVRCIVGGGPDGYPAIRNHPGFVQIFGGPK